MAQHRWEIPHTMRAENSIFSVIVPVVDHPVDLVLLPSAADHKHAGYRERRHSVEVPKASAILREVGRSWLVRA